jgi:hypothetical protein
MNTATATSSFANDSNFRRKARAFLAILRRSLEITGRAHLNGLPPL